MASGDAGKRKFLSLAAGRGIHQHRRMYMATVGFSSPGWFCGLIVSLRTE